MQERPVEVKGAAHEPRLRARCAGCSCIRLTTRTNVGRVCNECLAAPVQAASCPFCAPDERCALHL